MTSSASVLSRHPLTRWPVLVPLATLLAAVLFQVVNLLGSQDSTRGPHLKQSIPESVPGWTSQELPIGANEFTKNYAEKLLNFDEVLYREYRRGRESFSIYVAYWGPGKMPTRLVDAHVPDICWTLNGWHCLERRSKQVGLFAGEDLQPAEWRLFEPNDGGNQTYVLFWHLIDGRSEDLSDFKGPNEDAAPWWRRTLEQTLQGRPHQYFIRITSEQPFDGISGDVGFQAVIRSLGKLGLSRISKSSDLSSK